MRYKLALLTLVALVMLFAIKSPTSYAAQSKEGKLKIGFITVGPANDWGYNYAHNQGRLFLEAAMPAAIETTIVENIPENAEVERVMEKMIAAGTKLIFPTSYGYFEPALKVAARHPDVIFMQCGRVNAGKTKNLGTYFAKQYEPMYVAGYIAGKMTKKNHMGFVAAHPVPQVLQNVNAFTLGARSANPKVKVHLVWTNSWYDPATEAEATKGLVEMGCDVLAMHQDSPITVVQTAEKHGAFVIGYHADLKKFAPNGWLTGAAWHWGPLYVKIAQAVREHTWKSSDERFAMKEGYVKLSSFGKAVPQRIQQEALALKQKIEQGQYVVFQGPLKDRDGKERVASGNKPDFQLLESMDWLVAGVAGTLPKR